MYLFNYLVDKNYLKQKKKKIRKNYILVKI